MPNPLELISHGHREVGRFAALAQGPPRRDGADERVFGRLVWSFANSVLDDTSCAFQFVGADTEAPVTVARVARKPYADCSSADAQEFDAQLMLAHDGGLRSGWFDVEPSRVTYGTVFPVAKGGSSRAG